MRVLSFEREEIDQAWWNRRLRVALDVRRTLALTDDPSTTCYRLVHGEGDSLPGLVVDIYGSTAVVQCHSVGMYRSRQQIAGAIRTAYGDRITAIYDKSSPSRPTSEPWTDTSGARRTMPRRWCSKTARSSG